jgi:hypothetical protein
LQLLLTNKGILHLLPAVVGVTAAVKFHANYVTAAAAVHVEFDIAEDRGGLLRIAEVNKQANRL